MGALIIAVQIINIISMYVVAAAVLAASLQSVHNNAVISHV
jgi:hypothetical protein